jgi:hypothetical protein
MSKLGIAAALLVTGAMSLGAPASAAPVTSLSAAANPVAQQSDLVQVRYGGWHGGGGGWHGGWHGGGFPAAALAGALIGGAIAAPYYGGGYNPYYDDAYGYAAPTYVDPGYVDPVPYPAPYYGNRPGYYRGCYPHCGWGG